MGLFSKTGFFGKIWGGIKSAVSTVFKDAQVEFLPEIITITEDINQAVNSGVVEDIVAALSPELAGVPAAILKGAQILGPKILATELGLEALGEAPTEAATAAWVQSVIAAYAKASIATTSKIWISLATSLTVLYNQGKAENATWNEWENLAQQAFNQVQAAIAAAKANPANATAAS